MSRHDRKVPVGFYHRFTRETCELADVYAGGRVVSVLEGGYSDRALTSGAMAHLCGLVDVHGQVVSTDPGGWVDDAWWCEGNLIKVGVTFASLLAGSHLLTFSLQLEKAVKPRKTASARASMEEWLARTVSLLSVLDGSDNSVRASSRGTTVGDDLDTWVPPTSRTLRERKKPVPDSARKGSVLPGSGRTGKDVGRSVSTSGKSSSERAGTGATSTSRASLAGVPTQESGRDNSEAGPREEAPSSGTERKKLPRVILHVRPPDKAS